MAEESSGEGGAQIEWGLAALEARRRAVERYQRESIQERREWVSKNQYFYQEVSSLFRFIIEPGKRVLCLRSEDGFLLSASRPAHGVGVELTDEMLEWGREENPEFDYVIGDPENLEIEGSFDYIIVNWIGETVNVQAMLENLQPLCEPHTRVLIYTYNHLWETVVGISERLGMKMKRPAQNWMSEIDINNLLTLSGYELLKTHRIVLNPKKGVMSSARVLNGFFARLPLIERLNMIKVFIARPAAVERRADHGGVSVIIPCRNEEGNIRAAVERIPELGSHTEIIFCDDKSTDNTVLEIETCQREFPDKDIKLVHGPGICKSKNVWAGFDAASQDIVLILDADLTVMPEELPLFVNALRESRGEFINGTRLVYPMPKEAMKTFNMIGNHVFSQLFSYILKQPIRDTLCGTKAMWRSDWERLKPSIGSWGTEDRWGDYELLFGAAKLNLKILDLPVHYQERIFGQTKMVKVFQNGIIMLRMALGAFWKLRLRY